MQFIHHAAEADQQKNRQHPPANFRMPALPPARQGRPSLCDEGGDSIAPVYDRPQKDRWP